MGLVEITAAGSIICLAGAAQSIVGFGYALFATPLLLWLGWPLQGVITLVATCSLLQSLMGIRALQSTLPWRETFVASTVRFLGLLIGLALLKQLSLLPPNQIRAIVGGLVCTLVVVQAVWRPRQGGGTRWGWGGTAFLSSGVLAGLCGMGAPPLVLWSMSKDWSANRTRAFLFAVFATSIPIQLVMLGLTFGTDILWNALAALAFLPLIYGGAVIGLPIGAKIAKPKLRALAYAMLLVIGVSSAAPEIVALIR